MALHARSCVSRGLLQEPLGAGTLPGQSCLCLCGDVMPDLFMSQWLLGNLPPG